MNDNKAQPIVQTLSKYGEPYQLSSLLESELKGEIKRFGQLGKKITVTKSWIFYKTLFDLKLIRFDRLA